MTSTSELRELLGKATDHIRVLEAENAALKQDLQPTEADRDLANDLRAICAVHPIDGMTVELAAQFIEGGRIDVVSDFGTQVMLGDATARIEALEGALNKAFGFLGGVDDAADIRDEILALLLPSTDHPHV